MATEQEKLRAFENAVLQETNEQIQKLEQEVQEFEKAELQKARENEYNQMFVYMQDKVRLIKNKCRQQVTKTELDAKRELLLHRNQLTQQVFDEVKKRLSDFSDSPEYPAYLTASLKAAAKEFPCENAVVRVKPDDLKYEKQIKAAFSVPITVVADPKNHLGGFILVNLEKGVLIDHSFADLMQEQLRRFYEECGLSIQF